MKILILANNDVGLYQFRKELIQRLLLENEVHIALPYGALVEPLKAAGCIAWDTPMERRGMNPVTDIQLMNQYRQLLREIKPDLVITYTIKPNIYGGILCGLLGIPYAANITGLGTAFQKRGLLQTFVTTLYRIALNKAKAVFFENSYNMELFLQKKIVGEENSCLLSGAGVNLEHYSLSEYPLEKRVRFLFVGRVMAEKGMNELLAAMERLQNRGYDFCLDVLGGLEEDYKEILREFEDRGFLCYHGYQEDVRPFIRKAHCFVLPSYHEGMANTNLESAAMGRPVITSDIPGCREAVIDGKSGLLCVPGDVDTLCKAMEHFLCMSFEAREKMGLAGRRHMEKNFDKTTVVEKTIARIME